MDKLTKAERQAIRSLMQDGRFSAVEHLKKIVVGMYKDLIVKDVNEFETLWRVAQKEALIEGLEGFFNKMIQEASNDA